MKKSFFLLSYIFSIYAMGQSKELTNLWTSIDREFEIGNFKSIQNQLDQAQALAQKEKFAPAVIKAELYKAKLKIATSENDDEVLLVLSAFELKVKETQGAEKAVWQSYYAELLTIYYNENRYKIRGRTEVEATTTNDFRFWTNDYFQKVIKENFEASIADKTLLTNENSTNWSFILTFSKETFDKSTALTPSLYDVLVHNYVDQLTQLGEDQKVLAPYYQELAKMNMQKAAFNAFLYNQYRYLNTQKENLTPDEYAKELYLLATTYRKEAWYSTFLYEQLAYAYLQRESEDKKADYIKVMELQKDYARLYNLPQNQVIDALVKQIHKPSIASKVDQYVLPKQNIPIEISHTNLDKVFVKIYEYPFNIKEMNTNELNDLFNPYRNQDYVKTNSFINQLKLVESYPIELKSFDDYQKHQSIYKLNPLNPGRYIAILSNTDTKKIQAGQLSEYLLINSTAYTLVGDNKTLTVKNRLTGELEPNKQVEFLSCDSYSSKNCNSKSTLTANKNAEVTVPISQGNFFYRIVGENAVYSSYTYRDRNSREPNTVNRIEVLTDRAIYRPSQTVYFKGIAYQTHDKDSKVLPNQKMTFVLNDVNGKEVRKIELTSNEFGSVNGEFILPANGLTGQFAIVATASNYSQEYKTISVEEYKRPKFQTSILPLKGVYAINDEITIEGDAKAFSGATIDQGTVKYRVYRQEIFPYWPWYRSLPMNRGAKEELAQGETITDAQGKYNFSFIAKPASEKKKDEARTYNYFIEVAVTDINGETQQTESTVVVGDKRLQVNPVLGSKVKVDDLAKVKINVTNLNNEKVESKGTISIIQLKDPKRIVRASSLNSDYNYFSREEFIKLFPYDSYGNEGDPKQWELGKTVFETAFDTSKSEEIAVTSFKNFEEGYYVVKSSVMDGKENVENEKIIFIQNPKLKSETALFDVQVNQTSFKPGDKALISFASATKKGIVNYVIEANNKEIKRGVLDLNKTKSIELPIDKSHLGDVFVYYNFVKYNSVQNGNLRLPVASDEKKLTIETKVFRDKLTPGAKEKWQLTVSGNQKEQLSAEIVAAMYDASLDQFAVNSLNFNPNTYRNYPQLQPYQIRNNFGTNYSSTIVNIQDHFVGSEHVNGLGLNVFNLSFNQYRYYNMRMKNAPVMAMQKSSDSAALAGEMGAVSADASVEEEASIAIRGNGSLESKDALYVIDGELMNAMPANLSSKDIVSMNVLKDGEATALYGSRGANGVIVITTKKGSENLIDLNSVQARKDLKETAFFYPTLKTDAEGNFVIEFTTPESLTEWKLMTLAHTKDLKVGYLEQTVRTQKDLMVVPNAPRFLREGDQLALSAKISNLSDKGLSGQARLMLFDAFTMEPIDAEFKALNLTQNFVSEKGNSTQVTWTIDVPKDRQAVVYRVVASAGAFSDGEESALPILTNRMLVTETLPIYVKENQEKTFTFDHLKNNQSKTLDNFKLTFEMTTNPIWYAIFSLPYLREYPYECSEQVFARLYGNMVSEKVISSNPKIKAVFDNWNSKGELKSKLQLNQELKNIILEETPWVKNAESEEEQMKQIAVLFDLNKMQNEMRSAYEKLASKQMNSGGFAWFEGGRENLYITTHIVSGFGNMKKMGIDFSKFGFDTKEMVKKAIAFIDQEQLKEFKRIKNTKFHDFSNGLNFLYARSFFLDEYPMDPELTTMKNTILASINAKKTDLPLQSQALAAIVLNRFGLQPQAKILVNSIKERAVDSDEMGMYWKDNQTGWYWYQAPVETQALLIEAFDEVTKDEKAVEEMKVWLLKNRQTNQWNSTKATTKAVYALMNTGKSWLDAEKGITVKVGNQEVDLNNSSAQAGSGYVKTSWDKTEIKPEMGKIDVNKTSPGVAWGAMYWQYFEDLDKIQSAETGIKFNKKLFVKKNTANGPVLSEITANTPIKVGDLVTVRLEIKLDRDMQFVHIKDMRASGFEPVNVMSGYKWNGEFGFYESTRDAATNFFSDFMLKGTYVFEYDLKANNAGNFSNGITSMQNMYAPELSAQSVGSRVIIQ